MFMFMEKVIVLQVISKGFSWRYMIQLKIPIVTVLQLLLEKCFISGDFSLLKQWKTNGLLCKTWSHFKIQLTISKYSKIFLDYKSITVPEMFANNPILIKKKLAWVTFKIMLVSSWGHNFGPKCLHIKFLLPFFEPNLAYTLAKSPQTGYFNSTFLITNWSER